MRKILKFGYEFQIFNRFVYLEYNPKLFIFVSKYPVIF